MQNLSPRYTKEEFSRRGQEIFDRLVRPNLVPEDDSKFAAIDIESGRFEIASDDFAATELLLKSVPDAQMWLVRIGQPTAYRMMSGRVMDLNDRR